MPYGGEPLNLGAKFIGPEEWKKILHAAYLPTRRPVLEPWGYGPWSSNLP